LGLAVSVNLQSPLAQQQSLTQSVMPSGHASLICRCAPSGYGERFTIPSKFRAGAGGFLLHPVFFVKNRVIAEYLKNVLL
jgi:hypothetical protein